MRPGRVEVYRVDDVAEFNFGTLVLPGDWAWCYHAPNGVVISCCDRPYQRLRDLVRGLELAFPGYRLLDQNGALDGPDWFLWGLEPAWTGEGSAIPLPPSVTLGVGMRGVRIPVAVPAGVSLRSRR